MNTRVRSALIMLPLLLLLLAGGIPLLVASAAISAAAMYEFYTVFEKNGVKINKFSGYASFALLWIIIILDKFVARKNAVPASQDLIIIWIGFTVFAGFCAVLFHKDHDLSAGIITVLGVLYPGFTLAHIVLVNRTAGQERFVWFIFLAAFGTDIAAYLGGSFFGKHALCPDLSPKKTVEGAVAGILGSTVLCLLFGLFFTKGHLAASIFIGIFGSIAAQLGDVSASMFKRKLGLKDYSKLIPGHGGIMDRLDSVMFTAPFVYYFMVLFIK